MVAEVMDGANVWMVQCRCGPRLSLEPLQHQRIVRFIVRKDFEGNVAIQPGIQWEMADAGNRKRLQPLGS